MLIKDWFNYMTTLLISSRVSADEAPPQDGELGYICPCFSRNSDGEDVHADEENVRILYMHTEDGDISPFLAMPNARGILPAQTIFTLFTRNGPKNGTRIHAEDPSNIVASGYDVKKKTIVAAHGFHSNAHIEWMMQLKRANLKLFDANFISVDWSECANNCCYFGARDCAISVGSYLELLLQTFIALGADPQEFHLMGHSLGAHLVSQVSANGLQVARISAFDPPKWGFDLDDSHTRLDPEDAKFVDVIHTTALLGWNQVLGHADFFPNGAGRQPGCSYFNTVCGHGMSYYYYIQSLYYNEKYPAHQCEEVKNAIKGKCDGNISYMGMESYKGNPGIYYINVEDPATGEP